MLGLAHPDDVDVVMGGNDHKLVESGRSGVDGGPHDGESCRDTAFLANGQSSDRCGCRVFMPADVLPSLPDTVPCRPVESRVIAADSPSPSIDGVHYARFRHPPGSLGLTDAARTACSTRAATVGRGESGGCRH